MEPVRKISESVSWVGVFDPDLRIFDIIIPTDWGTTYNAYLIKGEKIALVEAVKESFFEEYAQKVRSLVNPADIDYIILNHTEPDHSGSLHKLLELAPNAEVVGSRSAIQFAKAITNSEFESRVVNHGDKLSLGNLNLSFISAPFLHWPDSIFTYLEEEQVLFTCDAFGCHYCPQPGQLFDDETEDFTPALKVYYQAIMSPFRSYVLQAIEKIKELPIKTIAPSHGPVLRADPWKFVNIYKEWSTEDGMGEPVVAIGYVSAYGYTKLMADTIADELLKLGARPKLLELSTGNMEEIAGGFSKAKGIMIGSPTLNRDAVPPVWVALAHLSAIENRNKPAATFGAYGWSGEAVQMVADRLKSLGLKVIEPGLRVNFRPSETDLEKCRELARELYSRL